MAHQADPKGTLPLRASLQHPTALLLLARLLRRNVDAVSFVLSAHIFAQREVTVPSRPVHLDAASFCRAVGRYALARYGGREDALATLRFWRIDRSEDIGQIVAGLVEAGLIQASDKDSPSDFAGLFQTEELLNLPAGGA